MYDWEILLNWVIPKTKTAPRFLAGPLVFWLPDLDSNQGPAD